MPDFLTKNRFSTKLLDLDSMVNSGLHTLLHRFSDLWSAYSAMLGRWHISGFRRIAIDLVSDAATFSVAITLGLLAYALPPIEDGDDIWNRGRLYSVIFVDDKDQIIGQRGIHQNDAIPLEEIPPQVVNAVLATEDHRFYDHLGVDFLGIFRAMIENMRANDVVQGGSSITQQLAKNLFLSPERTVKRKLREAFLALWIEVRLTKREILKLYLDRVYLGGGTYGVEAAAQYYFGKSIREANLPEAAMLAGLFKAPSTYAPHINLQASRNRASIVLDRMVASGYISEGEAFAARRNPAQFVDSASISAANHFFDWAYEDVLQTLKEQGLQKEYVVKVKSTLDQELQRVAQAAVNNQLDVYGKSFNVSQAALVSMRPDGAVQAMVGGRDYETSQFNRAVHAKRQPGSSFKPFVYLAAMRSGMTPKSVMSDSPVCIGNWCPSNYSHRYRGPVTLMTALTKSINVIPVRISLKIGRKKIIETAKLIGLRSPLKSNPSMPLGSNEVTVLDITSGYAGFANGGRRVRPYAVLEIRRPNGELLYDRERNAPTLSQTVKPRFVHHVNSMLHSVVNHGTGRRANLQTIPAAGKTGTTSAWRDAWFVGFTGQYVTGVWFGNDDYRPTNRLTGGRLPAMTWNEFMTRAHQGKQVAGIPGVTSSSTFVAGPSAPYEYAAQTFRSPDTETNPVAEVLRAIAQLFLEAETEVDQRAGPGNKPSQRSALPGQGRIYSTRAPAGRFSNQPAATN